VLRDVRFERETPRFRFDSSGVDRSPQFFVLFSRRCSDLLVQQFVMIPGTDMMQLLHAEPALRDRFVEHLLSRNVRAEAALLETAAPSRPWFRRRFAGRPTA
jgi:hypothetical protein